VQEEKETTEQLCQVCHENTVDLHVPIGGDEVSGVCEDCLAQMMNPKPYKREFKKIGRNDLCPWCAHEGESKKWKKCAEHQHHLER